MGNGSGGSSTWPGLAACRPTGATGCSASLVSKDGLVLTNHHCVVECEQTMSTAEQDYVSTGFLTHKRQEERLCPGMQAEILRQITDVTSRDPAPAPRQTAVVSQRLHQLAQTRQFGVPEPAVARTCSPGA